MASKTTNSKNEIQQFFRLVADEYYGLRDVRGRAPMEYRELYCPTCGKVTSHRLEFGTRLEKRRCTECGITRNYQL